MTDFVGILAAAIARQEGRFDSTNPGDLRDCPWFVGYGPRKDPKTGEWKPGERIYPDGTKVAWDCLGKNGYFWRPRTRVEGIAGMRHLIELRIAEGSSLRRLVEMWAPPSENSTSVYLRNVATWTGISDVDAPLWDLLPSLEAPGSFPTAPPAGGG